MSVGKRVGEMIAGVAPTINHSGLTRSCVKWIRDGRIKYRHARRARKSSWSRTHIVDLQFTRAAARRAAFVAARAQLD